MFTVCILDVPSFSSAVNMVFLNPQMQREKNWKTEWTIYNLIHTYWCLSDGNMIWKKLDIIYLFEMCFGKWNFVTIHKENNLLKKTLFLHNKGQQNGNISMKNQVLSRILKGPSIMAFSVSVAFVSTLK